MFNRKTICAKCGVVLLKSKAKKVEERGWKFAYLYPVEIPRIIIKTYCSACAPPYDTVQYDKYDSVSGYFAKLEVKADGTPVGYMSMIDYAKAMGEHMYENLLLKSIKGKRRKNK